MQVMYEVLIKWFICSLACAGQVKMLHT